MSWTTDDIPDLTGNNIVVTGANSGLGYAATKALAEKNAHVIMACRNDTRAEQAKAKIKEAIPDASLHYINCDLASLDSIEQFAAEYKEHYDELHVLCNNAGIMAVPEGTTEDGFERQLGINHLGHFALTAHLHDLLEETEDARVVTHSSEAHRNGSIDPQHLEIDDYDPWDAYARSKLANLLFAYELDRRSPVTSTACHPGFTKTNLFPDQATFGTRIMQLLLPLLGQRAEQGALPMLYAATDASITGSEYIGPDGWNALWGDPERQEPTDIARDEHTAEALWNASEELTGVTF